jgi:hypothetical protein
MGTRDRPIAPRAPWQNGHAERLIGSLRRECLDHVVVFGERHLRHMDYYNRARTHLSLNKDVPVPRAIQAIGAIHANPILGGLHYHYVDFRQGRPVPIVENGGESFGQSMSASFHLCACNFDKAGLEGMDVDYRNRNSTKNLREN